MRQKIGPKEAMQILGISKNTLRKYIECDLLVVAGRTAGGERRFWLDEVFAVSEQDLSRRKIGGQTRSNQVKLENNP